MLSFLFYKEPSGRVIDEVWNKGTSFLDTKYYYGEPDHSEKTINIFSMVTVGESLSFLPFLNHCFFILLVVRSMKLVMEMEFATKNRHRGNIAIPLSYMSRNHHKFRYQNCMNFT